MCEFDSHTMLLGFDMTILLIINNNEFWKVWFDA